MSSLSKRYSTGVAGRRADRRLYPIAEAYIDAVEADHERAHPVQPASVCIPPGLIASGLVATARALYDYSICPYDSAGTPLMADAPVAHAAWIVFENVYVGRSGYAAPSNAKRDRARRAGFLEAPGVSSQKRARERWRATVAKWGLP